MLKSEIERRADLELFKENEPRTTTLQHTKLKHYLVIHKSVDLAVHDGCRDMYSLFKTSSGFNGMQSKLLGNSRLNIKAGFKSSNDEGLSLMNESLSSRVSALKSQIADYKKDVIEEYNTKAYDESSANTAIKARLNKDDKDTLEDIITWLDRYWKSAESSLISSVTTKAKGDIANMKKEYKELCDSIIEVREFLANNIKRGKVDMESLNELNGIEEETPLIATSEEDTNEMTVGTIVAADAILPIDVDESLGLSTVLSEPISYMDSESFNGVTGVVANGFNKLPNIIDRVKGNFFLELSESNKVSNSITSLIKGLVGGTTYQQIQDKTVGIPAGITGYLLDIITYVDDNKDTVFTLTKELNIVLSNINTLVNSKEYRESYAVDKATLSRVEDIASNLHKKNSLYITYGRETKVKIGDLIRSLSEVEELGRRISNGKNNYTLSQLEDIRTLMTKIDLAVQLLISNKDVISKKKLLELAKHVDAVITLANGVATLAYLRNVVVLAVSDIERAI